MEPPRCEPHPRWLARQRSLCTIRSRRRRRPRNTGRRLQLTRTDFHRLDHASFGLAHKQSIQSVKKEWICFVAVLLAMTFERAADAASTENPAVSGPNTDLPTGQVFH